MQVTLAPFNGLEIVARSERTEVGFGGGSDPHHGARDPAPRASGPDAGRSAPPGRCRARDTVEAAAARGRRGRQPRRHRLDAEPPAPRAARARHAAAAAGKPAVDLLVSADTVRVGEQVDVVTAAWFPRDLRLQLRRPPTLQPPVIDGVWSYPQATPSRHRGHPEHPRRAGTISSSSHQVVFPLVAGHGRRSRARRSSTARRSRSSSSVRRSGSRCRAGPRRWSFARCRPRVVPRTSPARSARASRSSGGSRRRRRSVGEGVAVELASDRRRQHRALAQPRRRLAPDGRAYPRAGRRASHHDRRPDRRHQDVSLSRRAGLRRARCCCRA